MAIFEAELQKVCCSLPAKLVKFHFSVRHSSVFGKVRRLVIVIKYTYGDYRENLLIYKPKILWAERHAKTQKRIKNFFPSV